MKSKQNIVVCATFFFLFVILSSCKKDNEIPFLSLSNLQEEHFADLSYGKHSNNKLDVYLPKSRTEETPVVFLIHGGSWVHGDKADMNKFIRFFSEQHFAVVNVNYRFADNLTNSDSLEKDVLNCIEFIASKAKEFNISDDRFCLFGYSAGAQMSLNHAYRNNLHDRVKSVIAIAAPSNLTNSFYLNGDLAGPITNYIGGTYTNKSAEWVQNSPYYSASFASPDTYLLHGVNDVLVDVKDSKNLYAKLTSLHVSAVIDTLNNDHSTIYYLPDKKYESIANWAKEHTR